MKMAYIEPGKLGRLATELEDERPRIEEAHRKLASVGRLPA